MSKEFEREKIPVAMITAMAPLAHLVGAHRIVAGVSIPHPCGNPALSSEEDHALRREIVGTALKTLQTEVKEPTIFQPDLGAAFKHS